MRQRKSILMREMTVLMSNVTLNVLFDLSVCEFQQAGGSSLDNFKGLWILWVLKFYR